MRNDYFWLFSFFTKVRKNIFADSTNYTFCWTKNPFDAFSVLIRVCWTLREADLEWKAHEFLDRAVSCSSDEEVVHLAHEYVELHRVSH